MNTETILAFMVAIPNLLLLLYIIYDTRATHKRLLWLEENSILEARFSYDLSVRLEELEKWMQSQQPPTDQPEVKDGYDDGATTYEPTYYPLWIQSDEFKRLLVIQSTPEVKYWFKNKEVTFEQLKDILESLNGLSEPRTFVNVYRDDEKGRYISDKDHPSYKVAYEHIDNPHSLYLETVEIIRHKKA